MASQIYQITDKSSLQRVGAGAEKTPTVIYVSNDALPACREFTPKYEALAEKYSNRDGQETSVRFTQSELSSETSALFKFSPNQLPVLLFSSPGPKTKTLMSPSIGKVEQEVEEMLQSAGKLRN